MAAKHAVVWLDHHEARVFLVDAGLEKEIDIEATNPHAQLHRRGGSISGKRAPEDQHYLHAVVAALETADQWLIMGPGSAKLELVKHVHRHDPALADRIVGFETADHPTDRQVIAHARTYFRVKPD